MTRKLPITLYFVAAYLALVGGLFLLAPSVAAQLTHTTQDPTLSLLYGQYTLTFAFVALMAGEAGGKQPVAGHRGTYGWSRRCLWLPVHARHTELVSGRSPFRCQFRPDRAVDFVQKGRRTGPRLGVTAHAHWRTFDHLQHGR
jgi:hypothetical protein